MATNATITAAQLAELQASVSATAASVESLEAAVLAIWLIVNGVNISFMQAGFAMLEMGSVRAKHTKSILFKNICDLSVSALGWYFIGFGIAGEGASGAVSNDYLVTDEDNFVPWFHSFSFAVTAATIVSGAVAERMTISSYLTVSIVLVSFVYAVLVAWCWDSDGWLAKLGYVDFAGSGVVHLCGGTAALVACIIVGPRVLRFQVERDADGRTLAVRVADFKGHSPAMSNLGLYILITGWISFNASSTLATTAGDMLLAGRAAVNTVLCPSTTLLVALCFQKAYVGTFDLPDAHNAVIVGLVAITASCAYVDPWAALVIGALAFPVLRLSSKTVIGFMLDDPLDAASVHGTGGIWGLVALGLFGKEGLLATHFAAEDHGDRHYGIFYGGDGSLLLAQIIGAMVIMATTAVPIGIIAVAFKFVPAEGGGTLLRVDRDTELLGLDFKYHEGSAYPELSKDAVEFHNLTAEAERRARARPQPNRKSSGSTGSFMAAVPTWCWPFRRAPQQAEEKV